MSGETPPLPPWEKKLNIFNIPMFKALFEKKKKNTNF